MKALEEAGGRTERITAGGNGGNGGQGQAGGNHEAVEFADGDGGLREETQGLAGLKNHHRVRRIYKPYDVISPDNSTFQKDLGKDHVVVVASPPMSRLLKELSIFARSDAPVLITGESGVGKEALASLLHYKSGWSKGPFVSVNCAAIPSELVESEMFGLVRGAFTGALRERFGLFGEADSGTLFLDEIAEMSLPLQSKLLRALQTEGEMRQVGASGTYRVNCRIVTATNRSAKELAQKLRADILNRIAVFQINVPPLRKRPEDIQPLAEHFLALYKRIEDRLAVTGFTAEARQALQSCPWPGNVRQLSNAVRRAVMLASTTQIDVQNLQLNPPEPADEAQTTAPTEVVQEWTVLERVERNAIIKMLVETGGNKLETARRLGIGRQTLYNKIKAYRIEGF
ncbi:MAG: sigma-54 dependent transcriptional regulator [Patescibacteria group bacterium]|nr:sigma-54 dependent transcriptional regulator [Patescibacteria group bacterium]